MRRLVVALALALLVAGCGTIEFGASVSFAKRCRRCQPCATPTPSSSPTPTPTETPR